MLHAVVLQRVMAASSAARSGAVEGDDDAASAARCGAAAEDGADAAALREVALRLQPCGVMPHDMVQLAGM